MPLTLLLGGARSGKSSLAVRLARAQPESVVFVATGEPGDDEMAVRIARHRAERPAEWTTVEVAHELEEAIASAPPHACVIVDCLTLWLSNVLGGTDDELLDAAARTARRTAIRTGRTIAVSNEVGSGIVPLDPEVRRYRDLLGAINGVWAAEAETTLLVVAGRALRLEPPDHVLRP